MRALDESTKFWVDVIAVVALGFSLVLSFPRQAPPERPLVAWRR